MRFDITSLMLSTHADYDTMMGVPSAMVRGESEILYIIYTEMRLLPGQTGPAQIPARSG